MKRGIILLVALVVLSLVPAGSAQSVIILTSDNPSDLSVAEAWAHKLGANVVETPWGTLSEEAKNKVLLSTAELVYVIGGEVAVPDAESELEGFNKLIIRVGGKDRYETSLEVARRTGSTRAVLVDGHDYPGFDEGLIVAKAESAPIIVFKPTEPDLGETLKGINVLDATLIKNPTVLSSFKDGLRASGIVLTEPSRDSLSTSQKMIDRASNVLNDTEEMVLTIRDAPTLTAANYVMDSRIRLSEARKAHDEGSFAEAFRLASQSLETALYAQAIYRNIRPGLIGEAVSEADTDITTRDIDTLKDELRTRGEPYGFGLPVPPLRDLSTYMVDIPGYTKSEVRGTGIGFDYDIGAKYTKRLGQSINVEIYVQDSVTAAQNWMAQTTFTPGQESKGWTRTSISGYNASLKKITVPATDNIQQEVFIRVAVGNLGVFTKFTQSVRKSDADTLLLHPDIAQGMVEEVTREIIKAIEASKG